MGKSYKIRIPDSITKVSLKQKLIEAELTEYSNNEILIDKMLFVIYTLHRKLLYDGVGDAGYELINLKAVYLKDNLGRSGGVTYKDVIEALKKIKVVQVRDSYLSGEFTKAYGLNLDIDYNIHTVELLHWNPLGYSNEIRNDSLISKIKNATLENLKKIKVDTEYTHEITKREIDLPVRIYYNYFIKSITSGNDLDMYAEIDNYGRLHHNITGAAKELRPALSVNEKEIYSVDISASQLYFSIKGFEAYLRMKANTSNLDQAKEKFPDSTLFIKSVLTGDFYKCLNKKLSLSEEDLKKNKINILMPIFSQKNPKRKSRYFKALTEMFPTYMNYINTLKKDNYKDAARHLQTVESNVVIRNIAVRLIGENIWFLTVHDAVLCMKTDIEKVRQIILEEGIKFIGYKPHLKYLLWSGEKEDFSLSASTEVRKKRTSTALHKRWQRLDDRKQKRILKRKNNNQPIYSKT